MIYLPVKGDQSHVSKTKYYTSFGIGYLQPREELNSKL